MRIPILAALCVTAGLVADGTASTTRVAALDLVDTEQHLSAAESRLLGDALRRTCRNTLPSDRYLIMTRDNVLQLLPPGQGMADCAGDCAVETGRNLGARYVLTGDVIPLGGELRVTLGLYDSETANLVGSRQARGHDAAGLERSMVTETTTLLMTLEGAAPDQYDLEREVERRLAEAHDDRSRTNWILTGATAAAAGAAVYFHLQAEGAYDDHVAATSASAAQSTWDDYQQGANLRTAALGVASGLLLWRLGRVFTGPDAEDIRDSVVRERRVSATVLPRDGRLTVVASLEVAF